MADPPPTRVDPASADNLAPAAPTSSTSPAAVWGGGDSGIQRVADWAGATVPAALAPPVSVVSAATSAASLRRRQEAQAAFERERQVRIARFQAEEEAARVKMEDDLRLANVKSEAGLERPVPAGSAVQEQNDVVRRRIAELEQEVVALRRAAHLTSASPSPVSISSPAPLVDSLTPPVELFGHARLKIDKPKPWAGASDHFAREGFIKSIALYFGSVGVQADTPIGDSVLGVVRSLFSHDAPKQGGIPPQQWFDGLCDRGRFRSLQDVYAEMRCHWKDANAIERFIDAYRSAAQGRMKAQDFGAEVAALADRCEGRHYDNLDRRDTFVRGLRRLVREFYKVHAAGWRDAHPGLEPTFEKAVEIAARTDDLSGFAADDSAAKSLPSSSAKKRAAADSHSPSHLQGSATPSPTSPAPASWLEKAKAFQTKNTLAQRSSRNNPSSSEAPADIRCYNCGRTARHYLSSCPNARVDLTKVLVAAWTAVPGGGSTAPAPSDASTAVDAGDASTSRSDAGSGKGDGA